MKAVLIVCAQVVVTCLLFGSAAHAHPGGLDAQGGHTDRTTGLYHCHRPTCQSDSPPASEAATDGAYNRADWAHWLDITGNCMNTRHEVLLSQAVTGVVVSVDGCRVLDGVWLGPYTGQHYHSPSKLDIDHVIPLAWAHEHGGASWTRGQKAAFANDPINLLAVNSSVNRSKGSKGPDQWLPSNEALACAYLLRWIAVMSAYPDLRYTEKQAAGVSARLSGC